MLSTAIRVSVGMPAYNAEQWIGSAIESILGQSLSELELIISDNGSTDRTVAVCERYVASDDRVRLIRNERNLGAAANYNRTFREATAPLFKWASANDLCHPEFLSACVRVLDERPDVVLVYPSTVIFSDDPEQGELYREGIDLDDDDPVRRFLRFYGGVGLNNAMNGVIRAAALKRVPLHKPYLGSDLVTTAALTLHGKFVKLPEPYFYRRMNAASATKLRGEEATLAHFDPDGSRLMVFQLWRKQYEYLGAALRGPQPALRRARLVLNLLRRMLRIRQQLWSDLTESTRRLAARRRKRALE